MAADTILGLLIQFLALLILFSKLGRTWFRHLGAIFILMAILYHGVGEILISIFPGDNPYRPLFDTSFVGPFVLIVSTAILLFTIAYVFALGQRTKAPIPPDSPEAAITKRVFNYKLMALVTLPLLLLTLSGQGYGSNGGIQGTGVGTILGLSQQFFILGLVLAGFGFVMHFGSRWILSVALVESVFLALTGQRLVIVFGVLMLIFALAEFGVKPKRREVVIGLTVLLLFAWAITAARGVEGKFNTTSGTSVRLSFLTTGMENLFSSTTWHQLAFTLGYRLDGNSYGAMELQALRSGANRVGLTPLKNDVLLAIPSFLNPNKDSGDIGNRNEKLYVVEHLPIPELLVGDTGTYRDILPTQLGGLLGILGEGGMLAAALFLGYMFAMLDRWRHRNLGPVRMLLSLGALYCVLDYEGSWDTWTITLRGIMLLVVLVGGLLGVHRLFVLGANRHVATYNLLGDDGNLVK
jgi:hypothetical protein